MTDNLRFWVRPTTGAPHEVDLSEFHSGGRLEFLPAKSRAVWGGDFQGRPALAQEIRQLFTVQQPDERAATNIRTDFRAMFRFLDSVDPDGAISSVNQLTDLHGVQLYNWPSAHRRLYSRIKTHADRIRGLSGGSPLIWPARPRDPLSQPGEISSKTMQRLYRGLKREGMEIKAMFREGARLARTGRDPRGLVSSSGSASWGSRGNHAWLVQHLSSDRLPSKQEFYDNAARGLNKANSPELHFDGPAYLAPLMSERGREGFVGKLRWFHPSYHDTAVFLWLFLVQTGWNLSTALGLDISSYEGWFEDHPQKAEYKVLHAFKGRSDKHQFVASLAAPEWHPFQIVRFMIDRTAPIRRTAQNRLAQLRKKHAADIPAKVEREMHRLESIAASPWVYHVVNKVGEIGVFEGADASKLNDVVREVVLRHELERDDPMLLEISTTQARDAWIGEVYATSGHNVLLTQFAAQHSDARTLPNYLARHRYRSQSEKVVRTVQNAAFADISAGRVLDPTKVRILVQNGHITPEQERRLLDHRQRTRLGMGCLDPTHPPKSIAPDHVSGCVCRVQRCTGCVNGLVFEDSLDDLAKGRAQLIRIKGTIPFAAWHGSSFEDEERSLEATLASFAVEKVEAAVTRWLAKIDAGEVTLDDAYPRY